MNFLEAMRKRAEAAEARALELEAQRDEYLNREWIAEKARRAAEKRNREAEATLERIADMYDDHRAQFQQKQDAWDMANAARSYLAVVREGDG